MFILQPFFCKKVHSVVYEDERTIMCGTLHMMRWEFVDKRTICLLSTCYDIVLQRLVIKGGWHFETQAYAQAKIIFYKGRSLMFLHHM